MLISCITVTQPGRERLLALAVGDFLRQTHGARELVLVHDADAAFDAALRALAGADPEGRIRVQKVSGPQTLGALRNLGTDVARGELVCQWDDDDRCHPERLARQLAALEAAQADFCFLADQLHWYPDTGEMTWDDWDREPYPLNFVQGTLLGRRLVMPRYPEAARGEDTGLVLAILAAGRPIARMRGAGWCYVYVCHGQNAWDRAHHAAISRTKALGAARLLGAERALRERLAEYAPPPVPAELAWPGGTIRIG